ncbi:MAG: hypothetical protein A3J24_08670 [Deltaproteobacteria bacterium RIFCSPLOWO2_02_FULL_53_8]|nr:MAG: hypothetical protein A3J24_08670 [Deltaproteobacteria bacterium RIFCSPLOWO2_02_FULL_53_8]
MKKTLFVGIVCLLLAGLISSCATMDTIFEDKEPANAAGLDDKDEPSDAQDDAKSDESDKIVSRRSIESLELVNHGKQLLEEDNNAAAIVDFTNAISIDKGLADAYYYRGLAYDNEGDFERAVQDFSKTAAINPEYSKAYFGRGEVNLKLGEISAAIYDFGLACDKGYIAACSEREKLTGSLAGPRLNDEKVLP